MLRTTYKFCNRENKYKQLWKKGKQAEFLLILDFFH